MFELALKGNLRVFAINAKETMARQEGTRFFADPLWMQFILDIELARYDKLLFIGAFNGADAQHAKVAVES